MVWLSTTSSEIMGIPTQMGPDVGGGRLSRPATGRENASFSKSWDEGGNVTDTGPSL